MATDDFNRADAASLGANWTVPAGLDLGIFSNQVDVTAGSICLGYYSGVVSNDNQFSQATYIAAPNTLGGVCVRMQPTLPSRYMWGRDANDFAGQLRLVKYTGAVAASLWTEATTLVGGDILRLEVSGSTLVGYLNGVNKTGNITDGDFATGQPGLSLFHTVQDVALLDDWSGGDLVASVPDVSTWLPILPTFKWKGFRSQPKAFSGFGFDPGTPTPSTPGTQKYAKAIAWMGRMMTRR